MERTLGKAVGTTEASRDPAWGRENPGKAQTPGDTGRGSSAGDSVLNLPAGTTCRWVPTKGLDQLLGRGDRNRAHTLYITVGGKQVWSCTQQPSLLARATSFHIIVQATVTSLLRPPQIHTAQESSLSGHFHSTQAGGVGWGGSPLLSVVPRAQEALEAAAHPPLWGPTCFNLLQPNNLPRPSGSLLRLALLPGTSPDPHSPGQPHSSHFCMPAFLLRPPHAGQVIRPLAPAPITVGLSGFLFSVHLDPRKSP